MQRKKAMLEFNTGVIVNLNILYVNKNSENDPFYWYHLIIPHTLGKSKWSRELLLSTSKNPCSHGESTHVTEWGVTPYKCNIKGVFNVQGL